MKAENTNMEKPTKISATIIADSLNEHGQRLTTFVLVFPRIILAEFNTHRAISRNSASSRAIPFERMAERVSYDPFIPIKWMKDHPGMQGTEFLTPGIASLAEADWLTARDYAVKYATRMSDGGVTKQLVNRLLEPFMWHTVICTGTEWENFFALRAHEAAEIHMQELAHQMLNAYNESTPKQLKAGDWHIPFGDTFDEARIQELSMLTYGFAFGKEVELKTKIATARCARVSYNNFDGKDDYDADIKLHDRLASSGHWSPFEHCARAMDRKEYFGHIAGDYPIIQEDSGECVNAELYPESITTDKYSDIYGWCGNFRGFIQYRKTFEGENKRDSRVIKGERYANKSN